MSSPIVNSCCYSVPPTPQCFCPPGPQGRPGPPGSQGPQGSAGPQGATGPNWLWENNVFVDSIFGFPVGVRNDPARPFLTIAGALAASLPGDNIYVRTAEHFGSNLDLTGRNLYLQSATVTNNTPGTSLFIGSDFNIYGDGTLIINAGSAFNISGNNYIELIRLTANSDETIATIADDTTLWIKDEFVSSSPTATTAFNLTGTKQNFMITTFTLNGGTGFNLAVQQFDLNTQDITQTGTGTIFNQTGGFFNLQFDSITASGNIWKGMTNAASVFNGNEIFSTSMLSSALFLVVDPASTALLDIKAILSFTGTASFFEIHGQLFLRATALISQAAPTNPIFLILDTAQQVQVKAFVAISAAGAPVLTDTSANANVTYDVYNSQAQNTTTPGYFKNSDGTHAIIGSFELSTNNPAVPAMSLNGITNPPRCTFLIDNFNNNGQSISLFTNNCELSGSIHRINGNANTVCSFNLPNGGTTDLRIDQIFQNSATTLPSLILAGGRQNITMNITISVLVDGTIQRTEVLFSTKRWENNGGTNNATQLNIIGNSIIEANVELWNNNDAGANSVQVINLDTTDTFNPCVITISRFLSNSTPANNPAIPLISVTSGRLYLTGGDFEYNGNSPVAIVTGNVEVGLSELVFDFLTQRYLVGNNGVAVNQFIITSGTLILSGQTVAGNRSGDVGGGLVQLINGSSGTIDFERIDYSTTLGNDVFSINTSSLTTRFTEVTNNGDGDIFVISGELGDASVLVNSGNIANSEGRLFFLTNGNAQLEANYNLGNAQNNVAIELDSTFTGVFNHHCNYLDASSNCILIDAGAAPNPNELENMNISGRYVSFNTNVINNQSTISPGIRADHTILVAGGGAASILTPNPLTVYAGGVLTTNDPLPLNTPPANVTIIPAGNFASDPAFL